MIRAVHARAAAAFPAAAEARFAEWWAHCRPHPSGHQLHFDSDNEGRGQVRMVWGRFVSCTMYQVRVSSPCASYLIIRL